MNKKGISVVVPNYNGVELLPLIIPPLYMALKKSGLHYEVIISDDASTDNSVEYIEVNLPQIILIKNKTNAGFSPTINKGIKKAQYDYVFLLNSDVILTENYFTPLLRYFDRQDTFGVTGRVIGWDNETIQEAGKRLTFHGVKIKTGGNYVPVEPDENNWLYSIYLTGANALIDRSKLNLLNGFDEIYAPFYVEDYDLGLRAWRLGWKCYYEHFSVCKHKTSVTIKKQNKKNKIKGIYYRNKMFLHAIHLSYINLCIWGLELFFEFIFSLLIGRFYYLESIKMFLRNISAIKKSRTNLDLIAKKNNLPMLSISKVTSIMKEHHKQETLKIF